MITYLDRMKAHMYTSIPLPHTSSIYLPLLAHTQFSTIGDMDDSGQPLLAQSAIVRGTVDYNGRPALRQLTGSWCAAKFIILVIVLEEFAGNGLSANLITYMTEELGETNVVAAANVNAWAGVGYTLSLLGAFIADSSLGRFVTIVCSSLINILGMALVTIYALFPSLHLECTSKGTCSPAHFHVAWFYCSLYLVSIGQSCFLPALQAFGAAQFDDGDPEECMSKSSFFNWRNFGMCAAIVTTTLVMTYIQENIGWGIGFGIPCIAMALSLLVFIVGGRIYRYHTYGFSDPLEQHNGLNHQQEQSSLNGNKINHKKQVETGSNMHKESEVATILRLFPIWATSLVYAIILAQSRTFFIKQGSLMDCKIGSTFQVPSAALRSLISMTIVILLPIYDRVFVHMARKFTGLATGITMLQRNGIGLFLSMLTMMVAAMVETKRLQIAKDTELVGIPAMSVWWLMPQYVLFGIADVFTMVGLQEFFDDQVPSNRRCLGAGIYYSMYGVGFFMSSFLVFVIDKATETSGESWLADNLNRGHLDYFYWLLAGINAIELIIYMYFASVYVYKKRG